MRTRPNDPAGAYPRTEFDLGSEGLTKREFFAAMALNGVVSTISSREAAIALNKACEKSGKKKEQTLAIMAVEAADALIAALNDDNLGGGE